VPDRPSLPARRVHLVGRAAESESLRDRVLRGGGRLVTVTGAGGVGKTTLALEVARNLAPLMADGAALVDLASTHDPEGVATACSTALGVTEQERPPIRVVAEHLAPRHFLLVLDNCEHLATEVAAFADRLLDDCPDLHILATSRVPLRVQGEAVFVLSPMPVPRDEEGADAAALAAISSVALFAERAGAASSEFTLADWLAPVASICRRLDGLPLAIELAAAQVCALTPDEIDRRLSDDSGFRVDGGASADEPDTVRATLDWSLRLLTERERAIFRRLAVFAGGWTLEAAVWVCAAESDATDVPGAMVSLSESSLIFRDGHGGRFRMLAPVREYAERLLVAAGEHTVIALRHAQFQLTLVGTREADWRVIWPDHLALIAAEHENALAALRFAEREGIAPLVLGLDTSLLLFWRIRGLLRTGRRRLEAALHVVGAQPTRERGLVLAGLTHYGQLLGDAVVAEQHGHEAERILESVGDAVGVRTVLGFLGDLASDRGDFALAGDLYARARTLIGGDDNALDIGFWHANIGRLAARQGDFVRAEDELDAARTHLAASPGWYQAHVLVQLGALARQRGDLDRAGDLLTEALGYLRAYGASVEAIGCLQESAGVVVDRGDPYVAAMLFAAATRLRDQTGLAIDDAAGTRLARDVERARARLSSSDFTEAWSRGRQLTLEAAVAVATEPGEARRRAPGIPSGGMLTPRERDVAALVAEGLSNARIGEVLGIAQGTARIHVERILGKLGLTSRVQIATWVVRNPDLLRADSARGR
jgi:non-specific serine/threonine protein kinase